MQINYSNFFHNVLAATLAIALLLGFSGQLILKADAHEVRPSVADFELISDSHFQIKVQTNVEAMIAKIGAEHSDTDESPNADQYDELRKLAPEKLQAEFLQFKSDFLSQLKVYFDEHPASPTVNLMAGEVGDIDIARDSILIIEGDVPVGAKNFEWKWPAEFGASVIRVVEPGKALDEGYSAYLAEGVQSEKILLEGARPAGFWKTVWDYLYIGFTHIIPKGLDHILFVVGLFLLSVKLKPLLWQVTAFTLAHTVTLALGILGYIILLPTIVEPLIAASIAYVAIENIMTDKLNKWRPIIIFCFGLLHGLGFAGVLGEIGLSSSQFVTGLIAFNVGVEIGQLAVIALCFLLVGFWFGKKPWYRKFISIPASIVIALIALWWVYERIILG